MTALPEQWPQQQKNINMFSKPPSTTKVYVTVQDGDNILVTDHYLHL